MGFPDLHAVDVVPRLTAVEDRNCPVDLMRMEQAREPFIQDGQDRCFRQVHIRGMGGLVTQGIFLPEAATVVCPVLGPLALHSAVADSAVNDSAEHVWSPDPLATLRRSGSTATSKDCLRLSELV
nr:hypothetical protein [Pseudonocardia sp. HH130629-09]